MYRLTENPSTISGAIVIVCLCSARDNLQVSTILPLLPHDTRPDTHSGYAKIDCPGLQILVRDTAKAKHCPFADRHPGTNRAARSDPRPLVNPDRGSDEIERRSRPVMATRTKVSALRDAAIRPDRDRTEIVNPDIFIGYE